MRKNNIDLYLLPKSLFKSNIKYAEYIFSLENILKPRKFENKEILISDNSSDLLYLKENYNYDILKNEGENIYKEYKNSNSEIIKKSKKIKELVKNII